MDNPWYVLLDKTQNPTNDYFPSIVVRDYDSFVQLLTDLQKIKASVIINFDDNLDAAKWIVKHNYPITGYFTHTANEEINQLLSKYGYKEF